MRLPPLSIDHAGAGRRRVGQLGCRGQKPRWATVTALAAIGRALAVESDRWFLWLPVFFAAGIIAYFALSNEPQPRVAAALVLGAIGICLALRSAPLGLALAGAFLAFASGFDTAKLRTEITRALAHELSYVGVSGWVEAHELLRDKGRARLTIRVLSLGDLEPEERPYRVRVNAGARCRQIAASARQW